MKIYDCFMFYDEEMLLDLRLNVLNNHIDKFIISEATYTHSGDSKKLNFDINKFSKFKDKIEYLVVNEPPPNLIKLNKGESEAIREEKLILNGMARDIYQRQKIHEGLYNVDPEDLIMISDLDEIPNLETLDIKKIKNRIVCFKQKMFYYKFNLFYDQVPWFGSRACKKKNFISPQWLRDTKHRKYPLWRLDILFSKRKYHDIYYVENGGWHFTSIKSPQDIYNKLTTFAHHYEFESSGLKLEDIQKMVKEKKVMYDHSVDQRGNKWKGEKTLQTIKMEEMPKYIFENIEKYKLWLDI